MKKLVYLLALLPALLQAQLNLPTKQEVSDATVTVAADFKTVLCAQPWKEVGNWDNRGFGNDLDYDLLSENSEYKSEIVVFSPDGTYTRYHCAPESAEKGEVFRTGRWVIDSGYITMADNGGDTNKSRLIKLTDRFLIFDLMNRYRTAYIALP